jgi:hypothetical protein
MNGPDMKRSKQRLRHLTKDRGRRIRRLIERGMITDAKEIPEDAIPLDPDTSTRAMMCVPDTYYEDIEFNCVDCGKHECWSAESQQYYFEVMRASQYKQAKRCYHCRQKQVARRDASRRASGHDNLKKEQTTT